MERTRSGLKACPHNAQGAALTARNPSFRDDPHPVYDALRTQSPVLQDAIWDRVVVTGYSAVRECLRHKQMGVDARLARETSYLRRVAGTGVSDSKGDTAYVPPLVLTDDPDHRRQRALLNKAFSPGAIAAMADDISGIIDALLENIGSRENIDFIADYAGPLPTRVIARMMGLDLHHADNLKRWSEAILRGYDPDRSRAVHSALTEAYLAASGLFREVVAARRAQPAQDLISAMVRARDEDARLSDLEIISLCIQLLVAGNVTTTDLMGNGLHALLRFPAEMAKLRADPALIEPAVEEMLRYDCPITETARIPFAAEEVAGCPVDKGATLTLSLAAANHDPEVFALPHRFDITRESNPHLGFGSGVHVCLGAPLARLEARLGLGRFIAHFPDIALGADAPQRRDLPFFRGFETLPVSLRRG